MQTRKKILTNPPPRKQEEVVHGLRVSISFSSRVFHVHRNTPPTLASPIAMGGGDGRTAAGSEGSYTLRRSNSSICIYKTSGSLFIHIDGRLSSYFSYREAHDDSYHTGPTVGLESNPERRQMLNRTL